jgi:putative DNA primase/helicase
MADDWDVIDFDLTPETPEQRAAAEARAKEAGDKVVGDIGKKPSWSSDEEWEDFQLEKARAERAKGAGAKAKQGKRGTSTGPGPSSGLAPIELRVGETENIVNELETRLLASNRGLYQRGGVIVSTGFTKMPTHDGGAVLTQMIAKRGDYALIEDLEAVAEFLHFNKKGKLVPCWPPMRLVYTLKDREHRLRFPVLTGIVNCPSISADGELLDRPGYDPRTGILFDPLGVTFPRVPDYPTKRDAERALARILRLLETFDFVGSRDLTVANDDRAVALSLILTAIARRGLPFAPLHGFDAPVAGSGKSKIVDIASILATGHEAGVVAIGKNEEETHKTLSSMLMRGDPFIAIDNCDAPVEGALLNQMLTQLQVELRVLGLSKMVTAATSAVVTATGNNLVLKGDLTRRSTVSRLDPKVACPELRSFDYDPIDDAKRNRGELVVAVLTILKAYHNAGCPDRPSPPLQSFTTWSDTVRGALMWLGQGDPVRTMNRLRATDPTLVNLRAVLTMWRDEFGADPITTAAVIARAEETVSFKIEGTDERRSRPAHPLLRDALLQVAERSGKINTRALGTWLGKNAGRVIDIGENGATDEVVLEEGPSLHGFRRWQVVQKSQGLI